ncbi:retinol-binding protein pinta-like [Cydia pomonella]|uniref:retinol-binding protein pinta-like n=1 Tax=Cydia pomonella TaxID=82600 RepID=UPI002ADE831E|nr:retinol-binding protein pinta-like [Cydia pomonella]XP_061728319.1 retinol-binding protein pinta-like [Cydia pomonella]
MTIRPLSAALKEKAAKEINEDDRRIASDITALKDWLKKQPHLHAIQPTDQWLLAFLRGCKFSLERTKEKLDMYYTLKALVPEFLSNRDPMDSKIQETLKLGLFLPLKKCQGEDSSRTCIVRIGVFDASKYHLTDVLKIAFMITEIMMLEDDNFNVAGEEVIVDMKGVGISVLSQWTPTLAKKAISCFEKAFPVRVRSNYIISTPAGFEAAYAILKTFLGEKLKKRIKVYNQDYKAIYHAVPQAMLPTEYGGQDGSLQELIDYWKLKVESYRDWFVVQETVQSDEAKRPGEPTTSSTLFGVDGSFRTLQFD